MLIRLMRWLKGYVVFSINGKFPERFLNVCLKNGVYIFNTRPSGKEFYGSLILSDYRNIRTLAGKARVTLRIKKRCGLPFVISKYRSRKGLLFGALFFLIVTIMMQSFVWTIEINGIDNLSETQIRSLLKENGVYEGAFKGTGDFHSVERQIMKKVEDVGWISLNVIGTKAEVELHEKAKIPEILSTEPCNVKAKTDGVILSMNVKKGQTELPNGSAVVKGQLLISGIIKNSMDEIFFVPADGEVMAQTTHSASFEVEKTGVYKKPCGIIKRTNLQFLWFRIPLTLNSVSKDYTSRVISEKIHLNNTSTELGIRTQYCTIYDDYQYTLTDETAENYLRACDYLYRLFCLKDCESIVCESAVTHIKDKSICYVKYHCVEDIAKKEKIIVN